MRHVKIAALMLVGVLGAAGGAEAGETGYQPGQIHPDFELPKLDGKLGKLSDYRGKPVILINFASW